MHELGILFHIADTVMDVVRKNNLTKVEAIVLEVGRISAVVPEYLRYSYPAAVDGTMLEDAELRIEMLPANGRCRSCGTVFDIVDNNRVCPRCRAEDYEVVSGTEFNLKEILAY